MKIIKVKEEDERVILIRAAALDLYNSLRMLIESSSNREGIIALESAKSALAKAEGKVKTTES